MTAKQLIESLEKLDPNAEVIFCEGINMSPNKPQYEVTKTIERIKEVQFKTMKQNRILLNSRLIYANQKEA
jgi:hypothetical protein